jgi:hypothetical protein
MVLVTMRGPRDRRRAAKFDKPAVRIMFQITQIVRFLPGQCPRAVFADMVWCRQRPSMHLHRSTRRDSPFWRHFLRAMVHLSVISLRILRFRSDESASDSEI